MSCAFNLQCVVTSGSISSANISAPGVTGRSVLVTDVITGLPQSPGRGKVAYLYQVFMKNAVSDGDAPCVTDVAVDFGPVARLSYDGTGQPYDAFVMTPRQTRYHRALAVVQQRNTVDFCVQPTGLRRYQSGHGSESYFFGIASVFQRQRAATANVGWPGTAGLPTPSRAPGASLQEGNV